MPDIITVLSTIYEATMPPTVWIVNFYRKRGQSERYGPLMVATPEPSASAQGADRLALTVATMGVEVPCTIDAEDNRLRVILQSSWHAEPDVRRDLRPCREARPRVDAGR